MSITFVLPDDTNITPEDGLLPPIGSLVTLSCNPGIEQYEVDRIEVEIRIYYRVPRQLTWVYLIESTKSA